MIQFSLILIHQPRQNSASIRRQNIDLRRKASNALLLQDLCFRISEPECFWRKSLLTASSAFLTHLAISIAESTK